MSCRIEKLARICGNDAHVRETLAERLQATKFKVEKKNVKFVNFLTLTFVRPIDLVAPLNINGSFYNTAIIKQNNMAYQHKVIFCIPDMFGYEFGVGTYIHTYPLHVPYPCFEIRKNPNSYPNPIKTWKTRQIGFGSGR